MKNRIHIISNINKLIASGILCLCLNMVYSANEITFPHVYLNKEGKLEYTSDSLGNRIPDYSFCGYLSSEKSIPFIQTKIVVPIIEGDATPYIQSAIDYVASLPLDKNGFRGAILLDKGTYNLSGRLVIRNSGIVFRGSGMNEEGTILNAVGFDRMTLIRVLGEDDRKYFESVKIINEYVPVNATKFEINNVKQFNIGDKIIIHRLSNKAWIDELEMRNFGGETDWIGWKPGQRDIYWEREIISIHKNDIEIDVPITCEIDETFGGGEIFKYEWQGRIENIGIENLFLVSDFNKDNLKDEDHCWTAISIENAQNCWVRQIKFEHFAGSAVAVFNSAKKITIEDCYSINPISEIGGQRRYTFFTEGQQTLFQRCYSEQGYHDFSVGFCAPGPNAFVQCESYLPYSFSGNIDSWSTGVLYDIINVDGEALSISNREYKAQGAGYTGANCMLWECSASRVDCYNPNYSNNWAYGIWAEFSGNGNWYEPNSHIKPRSFYYAQLKERLGKNNIVDPFLYPLETSSTSSPSIELAKEFAAQSLEP
ncbi:DUF6298 domain-containing protein, partial [Bacteroidota bacterium]